jgi:hypothetical protein
MLSQERSQRLPSSRWAAPAAAVALAGLAWFVTMVAALHVLRADLDPVRLPTSAYAVGPFGFLMTTAFLSLSLALWALVLGLDRGLPAPARSRVGLMLMGVAAVGVLIAMSFPLDAQGAPPTTAGRIHAAAGPLTFLSLTAGIVLVSRRFRHDAAWQTLHRPAQVLAGLLLVAFFGVPLSLATGAEAAGLAQRVYLMMFAAWFGLTALRLRSATAQAN